ncbi:hypothetical protein AB6N24_16550 [Cellulomonas sp. 179-A 4D5 NHS]|uniref:hypothetical protein n=1 Tax=Cellulomonas sp. 179-A 4D5 NHS TaxID=3142378 RepID=UPI0039A3D28B
MTSSSADPGPATVGRRTTDVTPRPGDAVDARGRVLRLVAAALVAAGALLGASATAPGSTSAVFTDTETVVTTVRTVPDFDAPRTPPAPVLTATPTATPTATTAPAPASSRDDLGEHREQPRAPREGRGR